MDAEQQCFPIITALLHEAGGFFTMSVAQHQASKSMELQRIISAMHRAIPELHGVMIASVDGLAVACDVGDPGDVAALADGMRTLREDGWRKVLDGRTTIEEIVRTTKGDMQMGKAAE